MSQNEREAINSMIQYICENARHNQISPKEEYIQFDDFLKLMLYELKKIEGSKQHGGFNWNPFRKKTQPQSQSQPQPQPQPQAQPQPQQDFLNDIGEGINKFGQEFGKNVDQVGQDLRKNVDQVRQNVQRVGQEVGQEIQKRLEDTKNNMINYISGIQLQMTNSIATITIIDMINKYTLLCLSNRYMDENYCIQTVYKYLQQYSEYSPLIKQCVNSPSTMRGGKLKSKKVNMTKKILGGEPVSLMLIILGVLTSITSLALAIKDKKKDTTNPTDFYHYRNDLINKYNLFPQGRRETTLKLENLFHNRKK